MDPGVLEREDRWLLRRCVLIDYGHATAGCRRWRGARPFRRLLAAAGLAGG